MIPGPIDYQCSILSPSWRLAVELCAEVAEEEAEDVRVRIALGKCEPNPSIGIDGRDNGEPWTHGSIGDRRWLALRCPVLPHKCRLIKPCLIHIQYPSPLL